MIIIILLGESQYSGLGFQNWLVRLKRSQNYSPQNAGPIFPATHQWHPIFHAPWQLTLG